MWNYTNLRFNFTPIRKAKVKRKSAIKFWRWCEEGDPQSLLLGEPAGAAIMKVRENSLKLNTTLPYDPDTWLHGICPRTRYPIPQTFSQPCSLPLHSPGEETETKLPFNWQRDRKNVLHVHYRILFSCKEEWNRKMCTEVEVLEIILKKSLSAYTK